MSIIFQRRTNNSIVFASTKPHSADQKETSNNYRENATPMLIRSRSQITKIYAVLFRIICTYTNYENIRSTISVLCVHVHVLAVPAGKALSHLFQYSLQINSL